MMYIVLPFEISLVSFWHYVKAGNEKISSPQNVPLEITASEKESAKTPKEHFEG